MRFMLAIVVLLLLGAGAYVMVAVRTVSHDPDVWHVDPLTVPPSETPNSYRVAPSEFTEFTVAREAPIYDADAQTLAQAFDAFVMAQPRVERVAGVVEEGWMTYVQRTEMLSMPDYISVRFYDLEQPAPAEDPAPEASAPAEDAAGDAPVGTQDAVSQTAAGAPGATIAIYSRSRFGYGDMGVNEARVNAWLGALQSFER
ncbi:DUF1499 domain-containing protein [Halovulum dunhuangense]|uniref:DUF1499 domain-containing protein n=1 Tax=Halovulum dunhuangense TaxID=1505036 RepID=A0A849L3M7_9RHOB|nr:DUF1499 domain-containing protein [Halovulum dunhuangense]NNU80814.1 DUF1499 domain-containing protein [Halovulum dunhuangense]